MPDVITSTANPRIKSVRELHGAKRRKARHQTLIEGPAVFEDFLNAGFTPVTVLCTPDDNATIEICHRSNIELTLVTAGVLSAASDTRTPRGPVAVVDLPEPARLRLHNSLVLVDISDPGNVGTMIRSAAAFGWDVAHTVGTADPWAPKTLRSAAGGHVRTRLVPMTDPPNELGAAGLVMVATVAQGGDRPVAPAGPVALLIGSEAHGLPPWAIASCQIAVSIPMHGGTESLNAAVAASIVMYAMT